MAESPEVRAMLAPLLSGMLGGGRGSDLSDVLGGSGEISPEMMRQLEQMMSGGGLDGADAPPDDASDAPAPRPHRVE